MIHLKKVVMKESTPKELKHNQFGVAQISAVTRNRMNERPFLKTGISIADIQRFSENRQKGK